MDGPQVGQVRFMLVGLGLALLMVYRPQGIFGSREEMMLDAR
jgi:branched-chain amino acid transport system permease protein